MKDKAEKICFFIERQKWLKGPLACQFLAAGEYNENYLVSDGSGKYVFRINHGTQLNLVNQIEYEYHVLQAVESSGVTPVPYRYDLNASGLGKGVMLMQYLEGVPLDYRKDLSTAAGIFARIHALPPDERLIVQDNPARDIASESYGLLTRYPGQFFPEARARLIDYYREIHEQAAQILASYDNESMCMVNTEVNSGNFIISQRHGFLIDWEKAVVSHRYQDLAHFLVATTTLWKSEHRLSVNEKKTFLKQYLKDGGCGLDLDEVFEKTTLMERVILLRALSWCYMAYHEYCQRERALQHGDTFRKITKYLSEAECFLG